MNQQRSGEERAAVHSVCLRQTSCAAQICREFKNSDTVRSSHTDTLKQSESSLTLNPFSADSVLLGLREMAF